MKVPALFSFPAALLTVAVLSSCATSQATSAVEPSTPPPSIVVPTDPGRFATPVPDGTVDADTGEIVTQQPVAEWSPEARKSVIAAAETAMKAFARPGMDAGAWWAELEPLLSQQASQDYAYVDPANIPVSAVVGSGTIVDDASAYVAIVSVPTDVGPYSVVLSRADGTASWLAERITPPEGIN